MDQRRAWDERYAVEHYVFGEDPNAFLRSCAGHLRPGMRALVLADGEGRSGVWLAEQQLAVASTDISRRGQEKARQLAERRGVHVEFELVNLADWDWPSEAFDVVVAIFIQFAGAELRARTFERLKRSCLGGWCCSVVRKSVKTYRSRTSGEAN